MSELLAPAPHATRRKILSPMARAALEAMKGGWPGVLTRLGALLAGEGGGGRSCDCD